jgi:hypothetical protein
VDDVKRKAPWVKYDGDYSKVHYDVKTFKGVIHKMCWPNAGNFHAYIGTQVKGEDVEFVKLCGHPMD